MSADSPPSPKRVFLSYRRSPSAWAARAVYGALRERGVDVFMDVESIDAGRFANVILNEIAAREHFVLVLDPETHIAFDDKSDWVARELERALELGKNVVPLLLEGASLQAVRTTVGIGAAFRELNALDVSPVFFDSAMDALVSRFLNQPSVAEVQVRLSDEHWDSSIRALHQDDWTTAEREATSALARRQLPEYYLTRAVARRNMHDLIGALADATSAGALDPFSWDIMKLRSDLLQYLDRERDAIAWIGGEWKAMARTAAWRIARRVLDDIDPVAHLVENLRADVNLEVLHLTFDDPANVEKATHDFAQFLDDETYDLVIGVLHRWLSSVGCEPTIVASPPRRDPQYDAGDWMS